jgi:acyl carrier protein
MSQPASSSSRDRIAAIVKGLLVQRHRPGTPGPDDDLREAGLTSLDMVKLVLSLEQEFSATIPESDITPVHFRSINAIARLIETVPTPA